MQDHFKIIEHPRASWAEQRLIRQCRVDAPTARVVGELAGIRAASASTAKEGGSWPQCALQNLSFARRPV